MSFVISKKVRDMQQSITNWINSNPELPEGLSAPVDGEQYSYPDYLIYSGLAVPISVDSQGVISIRSLNA